MITLSALEGLREVDGGLLIASLQIQLVYAALRYH
jgi:hypothetical protein